jgi:hypothetical protein
MAIITITIPDNQAQRLVAAVGANKRGRGNPAVNPGGGPPATMNEVRQFILEYLQSVVREQEVNEARKEAERGVPDFVATVD